MRIIFQHAGNSFLPAFNSYFRDVIHVELNSSRTRASFDAYNGIGRLCRWFAPFRSDMVRYGRTFFRGTAGGNLIFG